MHPIQQHIESLSRRVAEELKGRGRREEMVSVARRLCGETLSWLVPRVADATVDQCAQDDGSPGPNRVG